MSDPSQGAGMPPLAEPPASTSRRTYACGTLKYTLFGLIMLFIWLLWGDFCWMLLNTAIPGILPLKLNQMGASDTTMALLVRVLGMGIIFLLNPIVSFKSDRYRSRWGRRIPFLIWSTPIVGLFMVLMGCYEDLTQFAMGDAQHVVFLGFELSRMAVSLIIFAVLIVGFDIVDIYNDTIYYYLFNDVVPPQFLARFLSLFRMVGLVATTIYNYYFMEHALTHFRLMWVAGGIAYTIGYLMMCFFIKEGEYPPPPENVDKRRGIISSVRTFAKECFSHRFYWYFFLTSTLLAVSRVALDVFGVLRNTGTLELSLKELGRMFVYLSPISLVLTYPAGWFADKYSPVRVYVYVTCVTVLSSVAEAVFIFTDFGPSANLMFMYFISALFIPFTTLQATLELPMYMRLLPKDRYGQFCSANGMVRAFARMIATAFAGVLMTHLGTMVAREYHVATTVIDVTATRTAASEWKEAPVGPWKVEYRNNDDRTGTITVPGASGLKVYFSEVRTEHGWDHLTTDADHGDDWSGNFDKAYSGAKSGDTITLRLKSNMTTPGSFTITKVAYQAAKTGDAARAGSLWEADNTTFSLSGTVTSGKAGVPGATASFTAENGQAPPPVTTDASGNWARNGFARGTRYRVVIAKTEADGTWTFTPPTEAFSDAKKDIKVPATWTEASNGWKQEDVGPWVIKYQNNWDRTGTITVPGASALKVYFEVFKTEPGVDYLKTDAEDAVDRSGNFAKTWSDVKSGDTITLRLTSGLYGKAGSNMVPRRSGDLWNDYEIRVTKVKYRGTRTGDITHFGMLWDPSREETFPLSGRVADASGLAIPAVTVSFRTVEGDGRAPKPVKTDAYGNWCQIGFPRGSKFMLSASKVDGDATWTFTEPTIGDWRYRYFPLWAIFFQICTVTCLLVLYREWKRRGGTTGYTPPGV